MAASGAPRPDHDALLDAAKLGRVDDVLSALSAGASPNYKDAASGRTAVHWACAKLQPVVLEALVQAPGINLLALDNGGQAPIHLVVAAGVDTAAGECGVGGAQPVSGARPGTLQCLTLLLDAGVPGSFPDKTGLTPLHMAAMSSCQDVLRLLVARCEPEADTGSGSPTPNPLNFSFPGTAAPNQVVNLRNKLETGVVLEKNLSIASKPAHDPPPASASSEFPIKCANSVYTVCWCGYQHYVSAARLLMALLVGLLCCRLFALCCVRAGQHQTACKQAYVHAFSLHVCLCRSVALMALRARCHAVVVPGDPRAQRDCGNHHPWQAWGCLCVHFIDLELAGRQAAWHHQVSSGVAAAAGGRRREGARALPRGNLQRCFVLTHHQSQVGSCTCRMNALPSSRLLSPFVTRSPCLGASTQSRISHRLRTACGIRCVRAV